MKSIKVSIFGADGYVCQIPRIKEGFIELGHSITDDSPDLIYSNDPWGYEKALSLKKKYPNAYLILNFLDVPWHIPNIEEQTKKLAIFFFSKADVLTTISFKVKNDLKKFYDGEIKVIYNPIKDVFLDEKIKKNNKFLYVGRANDPIKRIRLIKECKTLMPELTKDIKICGNENPDFGNYLGVVSDSDLNSLYNSSRYILFPSKAEGLGLPMIEGMVCGGIPITCSDNLTAKEFSPINFICEPNAQSLVDKINELDNKYDANREIAINIGKKYKKKFDKKSIAKNILDIFYSR